LEQTAYCFVGVFQRLMAKRVSDKAGMMGFGVRFISGMTCTDRTFIIVETRNIFRRSRAAMGGFPPNSSVALAENR
jgi:hypothetical protein